MWFLYNDAYLHVLGMAKHPWALGRPASEVWAEIWDVCGPLADKVFLNGEASFVDDVRLFMSRGELLEETFYSFSYSPIRDDSGHVAGLFCPSNDVTAKVVGARRLRTLSELAANALVEKSTTAACDSAAATLAKNGDDVPFAVLYLVEGESCTLQQCLGVTPDFERAYLRRHAEDVVRLGSAERFSLRGVASPPRGAAEREVLEALALPMAGRADSRPQGVLLAGLNPTQTLDADYAAFFELVASNVGTAIQNARAAQYEKQRADMLAEMDRAKTVFYSNVSHEFRTPLTLMLGPLEQLARTEDESQRSLAQTARRNALRLLKLVNTLLEFSRLEAGRSDAAFARTDLGALTRDVASTFRSAIESAGLRFCVETDLDEPVYVDRSMWERIVLNLLSNALKFTFEGEIAVTVRRADGAAELCVRDTGVGIAAEDVPQLFERFHRVRGAKSRSHEGSGIGLALVRDLAELHGGDVSVRSEAGQGTTFRVRVPLGKGHLDSEKIVADDAAPYASSVEQYLADVDATMLRTGPAAATAIESRSGRPCVLVADDNADLREYVSSILAARYDVTTVNNGRDALAAARAKRYDVIVSDVMMPEMDGFELLAAVRKDERIGATPFIILSARAGEEAAHDGLLRGADDYVAKPFSADELLARVQAQINASSIRERATRELRNSEQRFRTLAASLPYIVFETDPSGSTTFLSDEYAAYTGLPLESGYGAGWATVIHPEDAEDMREGWALSVATGEPFSAEFRVRRADGVYRWFAARALPQNDANGVIVRWIGTVTDVHDQRHAAREREFLARASEIFAQQLDLDATLAAIASFTVPDVADWCQIDLRTDDSRIRTVAVAHRDPEKNRIAQEFVGRIHLNPHAEHGSPYVIRTGKSQLIEEIPDEIVGPAVGDEEETRMYRELGLHSVVAVPLVAEGETLGMLAVLYGTSRRRYSADDVPMLEELGRRAGLAIHKARLFEREHRAAESFQEASLPATLPEVPGLSLDAFYAPGRAEAQVGGDWYDALRLIDGRVVISIGDVAGSGLDAAVTMGNMRQIIRGIAQVHADPGLMLDAADRALRLEHPDKFVTAFVGVFDGISNTLTYASAGHPPPLLRRPDGRIDELRESGLPLGLRANERTIGSSTVELKNGSSLILYTDGLTEFDRAPAAGERRLQALLSDPAILHDARPARRVVQRMMDDAPARDDVAVLVVNVVSPLERDGDGRALLQRWALDTNEMLNVGAARAEFAAAFREHGGAAEDVAMAEVVFGELVSNTVRYAPGAVEVIVDWSGPEPVLHVLDNGPGFRHISILPPDLLSESGRGLFIVSALTHDFRVSKRPAGGSHARAVLRLQSRQLVSGYANTFAGSLLHALTESVGIRSY
jgi:PAS domain S-box-containing protein